MSQPHASYDDDLVLAAKRATPEYKAAHEDARLAADLDPVYKSRVPPGGEPGGNTADS